MRDRVLPGSRLKGAANILVMPEIEAANIAYQLTKMMADALPIGLIVIGAAQSAHILTATSTVRGLLSMTAITVVEAHDAEQRLWLSNGFFTLHQRGLKP